MHPAQGQPAEEWRGVEVRHLRLERRPLGVRRRRNRLDDRREQCFEIGSVGELTVGWLAQRRAPRLRRREHDGEVQGVLGGLGVEQVQEELVRLLDDVVDPRVGPVHLVDDQDHRKLPCERLAEHEARLRQRPFRCVDEQYDAVDHRQAALHLAAEVRVAGVSMMLIVTGPLVAAGPA